MIEVRIAQLLQEAFAKASAALGWLALETEVVPQLEHPKQAEHGDLTCNLAMILASKLKLKPRDVAQALLQHLPKDAALHKVEIAGPGFLNFWIDKKVYLDILTQIEQQGSSFGKANLGQGKKVMVEFVSANPTGPLHIGHGRGAVYGDALASVLSEAGYKVSREYYLNDAGVQMLTLGKSVWLRMREIKGEKIEFPEKCYQGAYIRDIAQEILDKHPIEIAGKTEEQLIQYCSQFAGDQIFAEIKQDLADIGVTHENYFLESSLHQEKAIEKAFEFLDKAGFLYTQDGALWFRTTQFGDDKDRVLKKSDGQLTYFAADIAYHKNKYDRGFDRVINVLGADHAGYVGRMKAAVQAFGRKAEDLDMVLNQLVNLIRGGDLVSMSTRSGEYETLHSVTKDVGKDVCRYFFLMRSHQAQLDFDLDLAREQSPKNPVFYIQYAHARICSVFRQAQVQGITENPAADLAPLDVPEEFELCRKLAEYPQVIARAATDLEPHRLSFYLLELAQQFQSYYSKGKLDERYRILSGSVALQQAKLRFLKNIQIVLQNGLRVLGLSAPEEMNRDE